MIPQALIGTWIFTSMIYHGQVLPPANPALRISLQIEASATDTMSYHHDGETSFCERQAHYSYQQGLLSQEVTWVNPNNAEWCSQDTDMQLGNRSVTPAWIENQQLHLRFQLGDDDVIYVWDLAH